MELWNIVVRRMGLGLQRYQNVGIGTAHRSGIAVREIYATIGQANVVDDALHFGRRNLLSNRLLDLIAEVGGLLNTHSRGSAHVKLERATIHAGKEIPAKPRNQHNQRADAENEERNQKDGPVMEADFQQTAKAVTKLLECLLKTLLQAYQRIAAWGVSGFLLASSL